MHTSTTSTVPLTPWTVEQLQQATQGEWYQHKIPQGGIKRILTDSRHAEEGDAFLALKGERFDAHDFVKQVATQGCQIAIVERPVDADIAQLIVKDTRLALGQLGAYRRQQNPQLKVIALTGSSGKTTTKEMLGSILSRLAPTLITRGNLNNDLGVPMMLLELRPEHQYAVMELGASHIGEIDYTSNLVQPQVAGILNIGTAHLGEFGGREKICQAKSEIYRHIAVGGTSIVPAADDFTAQINTAVQTERRLSFGEGGDVFAEQIQLHPQSASFVLNTPQGSASVELPFAGLHNVQNALAACAFALAIGVSLDDVVQGLQQAKGAKGRLNFIQHEQYLLIDDTYNANPTSMRAAAEVLTQQQGIKVMVMGDIGELGAFAPQLHAELGVFARSCGLSALYTLGEHSVQAVETFGSQGTHFNDIDSLIKVLKTQLSPDTAVIIKGSRFMRMERVAAAITVTP